MTFSPVPRPVMVVPVPTDPLPYIVPDEVAVVFRSKIFPFARPYVVFGMPTIPELLIFTSLPLARMFSALMVGSAMEKRVDALLPYALLVLTEVSKTLSCFVLAVFAL